jgi:hypothetical protein
MGFWNGNRREPTRTKHGSCSDSRGRPSLSMNYSFAVSFNLKNLAAPDADSIQE